MREIATEPGLLSALKAAAHVKLSHEELLRQRIDYIMGCLSDEGTKVTRAQVVRELEKLTGEAA